VLERSEDYAHQQASPTRKKLRQLELTAGAPKNTCRSAGIWSTHELMRTAERELAVQADASYRRMVQDQRAGAPASVGSYRHLDNSLVYFGETHARIRID